MDKILLKQAAVMIGCKFFVDDYTFILKSASPLVVLDRFIGSIIGVPFTVNISESNTYDQLIMKKS